MIKPRDEANILQDLAELTWSPGYIHALASIAYRDNVILSIGDFKPADLDKFFRKERLLRTEFMTVLGLMTKKPVDLSLKPWDVIEDYTARTDALMHELHEAMNYPVIAAMVEAVEKGLKPPTPWQGAGMREPIFYGSESAYAFQYKDFIPEKYGADDSWLQTNKGFSSNEAKEIAQAMGNLLVSKAVELIEKYGNSRKIPETLLPANEFTIEEVSLLSNISHDKVEAFFKAFTHQGNNAAFNEVGDFNEVVAWPLIPTGRGTVLLFSSYSLYEALYESPFFWMWDDKAYRPQASKNRGNFTEQFAKRRLETVFGHQNVFANVNFYRGKEIVGEADVLVVYGDRLIIGQAKAKKLTIKARKGNDNQLKEDFAAAIQDSYDQGLGCAKDILKGDCKLLDDSGMEVKIPKHIKDVFIINIVSEHYPALAFQTKQSLKYETTDIIRAPFVMDVFLLDTMTEMLTSPLRLLSYIKLRVAETDRLMSGHELNVLGYHLKSNLWLSDKHDIIMLDDSLARDLDAAMIVRRENQQGADTPEGILTRMRGSRYERLIQEIEDRADPAILELGFHLLSMDESACKNVHRFLEIITRKSGIDGKPHDITLASADLADGITFHCNPSMTPEAISTLKTHCSKRKYKVKAEKWFGVSINVDGHVQFGVTLDFPWEHSHEMEQITADMKVLSDSRNSLMQFMQSGLNTKIGRNDPCYCGSGHKYKKCCLI